MRYAIERYYPLGGWGMSAMHAAYSTGHVVARTLRRSRKRDALKVGRDLATRFNAFVRIVDARTGDVLCLYTPAGKQV